MPFQKTYYDILGIGETADETEIKKAYRALSLKHHPDRGGNAEIFKEVSEAFQTLSDPHKRREYDMERQGGSGLSAFFSGGGGGDDPIQELFQNLFSMGSGGPGIRIFHTMSGQGPGFATGGMHSGGGPQMSGGGGFNQGGPQMGTGFNQDRMGGGFAQDRMGGGFAQHPFFSNFIKPTAIHVTVSLDLEQVATGCVVPVSFDCYTIRDERRIPDRRTIELAIHQGVEDGEVISIPDMGNSVNGIVGDVRVTVEVAPHDFFRREGLNLHYTQRITLLESLCGFQYEIPLLGHNTITVKNVKQPVKIIYPDMQQVCTGYGLRKDATVGALIIHFSIVFPESLTDEQRDALRTILS